MNAVFDFFLKMYQNRLTVSTTLSNLRSQCTNIHCQKYQIKHGHFDDNVINKNIRVTIALNAYLKWPTSWQLFQHTNKLTQALNSTTALDMVLKQFRAGI